MTVQLFTVPSLVGLTNEPIISLKYLVSILLDMGARAHIMLQHVCIRTHIVPAPRLVVCTQSRMLVTEHGLLSKIVGTLLELLTPCRDPG